MTKTHSPNTDSAMPNAIRVMVTGGGTGGHIYPALAVAEHLKNEGQLAGLLFVGKPDGLEASIVPKAGVNFEGAINFYGMPRKLSPALFAWFWTLFKEVNRAKDVLRSFKPDVVFATGGYVTAPILIAAKQLSIPYMIHEPDAQPGLVNRLLGRWASQISAAFPQAQAFLKNKTFQTTGNPLRGQIGQMSREKALTALKTDFNMHWQTSDKILLITGGSQGARTLNNAVLGALHYLINETGFKVIHQTGDKLYDEVRKQLEGTEFKTHPSYIVRPFFNNMPALLGSANIAVCRAGSLTLSELFLCHIPAILVPYPYAASNHQQKNAQAAEDAGAATMILDATFSAETLSKKVAELTKLPNKLNAMARASESLAHPNATGEIAALLKKLVNPHKG